MQTKNNPALRKAKEIGLLFKPDLIRALLRDENPKTQTRRIVDPGAVLEDPETMLAQCRFQVGDRMYAKESLYLGSDGDWHYEVDHATVMVDKKYETEMLCWAHHKQNTTHSALFMPKWAARTWRTITEVRIQRVSEISEEDAITEGIAPLQYGVADMGEYARYWSYESQTTFVTYKGDGGRKSFRSLWNVINGKWTPVRKKGELIYYISYPWSEEHILDKPLNAIRNDIVCTAIPNPWVWCLTFHE